MAVQRHKVVAAAEKLVAGGKIREAIAEYHKLVGDNPNDVNTLIRIADLHIRINENEQAADIIESIAAHYSRDGFFLKSVSLYKKLQKLVPARLDVYEKLASLYERQGLPYEARLQLELLANHHEAMGSLADAASLRHRAWLLTDGREKRTLMEPAIAPETVLLPPQPAATEAQPPVPVVRTTNDVVVFLCHAHEDKAAVRDLYARLLADRFQPWLDEEDLIPGQDWQQEIPRAVRRSHVVVVCLSSRSVNKAGYLQKEIKFALDVLDEQPEGMIFVVPARLEPCDVPQSLSRFHYADLFSSRGYDNLKRALELRATQLGFR